MLALIDVYGLSGLAKIGHGYAKELEEEHYSASSRGAMAKRHSDELAHERRRTKIPRTSAKANPINYVLAAAPPFLIMVGDQDKRVLLNQSELMREALPQKGADSKLIVVKGADRG